jgi:predicted nucleic acid-binding Zn ribbon protein
MQPKVCVVCTTPIHGQKLKYCSNACKQKDHYHRVKQQTNTYHSQTLRSLKRKLLLIEMFGGKCQVCGYSRNASALHFHHMDSTLKKFKLDVRILSNRKWEDIVQERAKCRLLCSNCHAELHNPELELQNIQRIISGAAGTKLPDGIGVNSGKPSPANMRDGNPEPSRTNG